MKKSMPPPDSKMADFDKVRDAELEEIQELRNRRQVPASEGLNDLTGLCFSGGGIRSATFCLGVLQGLATYRLLRTFDYISSVSGGGYIATWLVSWIKRPGKVAGKTGIEAVEEALRKAPPHFERDYVKVSPTHPYQEPGALNFLRSYSNYLTPRLGFFGADTWAAISSYFRNLMLNQTILISSLAAVILVPRFVQLGFKWALCHHPGAGWIPATIAVLLLLFALAFIDWNVADFSLREAVAETAHGKKPNKNYLARSGQGRVLWMGVMPIFASAVLGALALAQFIKPDDGPNYISIAHRGMGWWIWLGAISYLLARAVSQCFAWILVEADWHFTRKKTCMPLIPEPEESLAKREFWEKERKSSIAILLPAPLAGALGGILVRWLCALYLYWMKMEPRAEAAHIASWGPPLLIGVVLLTGVLHVGLSGLRYPNQKKEWWARLAAWLLIWTLSWTFIFALALFAPMGVLKLSGYLKTKTALLMSWAATTLYGVLAGKSPKTSGEKGSSGAFELFADLAPYVFIVGTLVLISYGIHVLVVRSPSSSAPAPPSAVATATAGKFELTSSTGTSFHGAFQLSYSQTPASGESTGNNYWNSWRLQDLLWLFIALVAGAFLLAWRVDINEFSLHLFYRNRLVRCYLGATNPERCPHPFTGFDPSDDISLADFAVARDRSYSGPYPILNAALNISHGQRLAWQERKAESFVLTPRYCGFDFQEEREEPEDKTAKQTGAAHDPCAEENESARKSAYRESLWYAYPGVGPYLGTAMAISGAAVNPNMGYHASPALAFLLTLFNVRLGWWMGNPRRETWTRSTPRLGIFYLLRELFGLTDETSRYVNLSDGWHFENLGLYELVRRKCKYILICDVGADSGFAREDLGNAVRKCRSDFGAAIELDPTPLRPNAEGFSKAHLVAGTIQYPDGETGHIIYVKSGLTGDEPQDILAYKVANPVFPHQGTADQWFDESQFESYRALGRFAIESALNQLGTPERVSAFKKQELFEKLSRL